MVTPAKTRAASAAKERMMHAIGIDVGSTCTKAAALDKSGDLVFHKVVPTGWNCIETAQALLLDMAPQGIRQENSRIVATGYGRVSIPFADKAVTEISCHGKGAAWLFSRDCFTVIDIGGQDTKIIEVKDGQVRNFIMNDKCSAGTGRFLDIMAGTLGVELGALCELARRSGNHVTISSMCTVFAESEVVSLIGRGTKRKTSPTASSTPSPARCAAKWESWASWAAAFF